MNTRGMTYPEAVSYIESIPKFTSKTDLCHTQQLLDALGNPENALPHIIHAAGTNGKGSVCAYLNSALMEGGYRCGLFTSPHLIRINERVQINGREVSDDVFLEAFRRVMAAAKQTMSQGAAHPTYFETLFLIGICVFQEAETDWCILETGMGGRLDQTNVIQHPDAAVITSISMDHIEYLGDTIEQIASEKAGIIKPYVPVIYDGNRRAAAEVVKKRAKQQNAPALAVRAEQCECLRRDTDGTLFRYLRENAGNGVELQISSIADYQMMNAALAYETMKLLADVHGISDEMIRAGIAKTKWPCRMECTGDGVVIDGAHNADGIRAFIRTARHFHETGKLTVLFGAVSDKDYPEMIREIAGELRPEHVITASVPGARGVPAEVFAEAFRKEGCPDVIAEDTLEKAYRTACKKKEDGMLFCVGSLYLAGALKKIQQTGN